MTHSSCAIGHPPHILQTAARPICAPFKGVEWSATAIGETFAGMVRPNNLRIRPIKCFRHLSGSSIFCRKVSKSASRMSNSAVISGISTTPFQVSVPLIGGNFKRIVRAKPHAERVLVN